MDALLEPFARLLADIADREGASQIAAIEEAGFLDALVAEASGGAGLSLAEVQPLITAVGYHGISAPVAEIMAGRATGSAAIPRPLAAVLATAEISGAVDRVLAMSLTHANDRIQFGKPIGKQQAIQHNLAIMGEQVLMARMAAQMGCAQGLSPDIRTAATAKHVASIAARMVAEIGHAVHGAIGITQDHDLHRYTARLHALRMTAGAESYWAEVLGDAVMAEAGSGRPFHALDCLTRG